MNGRYALIWFGPICLLCLATFSSLIAEDTVLGKRQRNPNIVLIISDDQAWTDFGFMGHNTIKTPSLDRLAEQSYVFTRGYVPTSLCRPSLATIITGLYASQHGITGNDPRPPNGVKNFRKTDSYRETNQEFISRMKRLDTLPRLLGQIGYVSFQSGKWWEGNFAVGGFNDGMTHGDPDRGGRHGDDGLKIGRQGLQPIFDFIDKSEGKPFFVWYAPFLPHTPHNPPKKFLEHYTKTDSPQKLNPRLAKYYAMCEWFDDTCGKLLAFLDEKKLGDNTIVIFVTDNGWIQRTEETKTPTGWRTSFAPRSKQSPYEAGIRTPIMIRWPKKIKPQMDRATLASSIDIAPTILAACGLKPTQEMLGINLMDIVNGNANNRRLIWGEIYAHDIVDINQPAKSLLYRWAIQDFEKIVTHHDGQVTRYRPNHERNSFATEFFDLKSDPFEAQNLADQKQTGLKLLESQLKKATSASRLVNTNKNSALPSDKK